MSEFFLTIINMSISASWIVLAVLLLRLLLKKAPKWITVLLWGIVAVRLICPFTIESVMSLIPSSETISPEIMMDTTPEINSGIPILNNTINPVISESFAPDPTTSANPLQILIPILSIVWIVGIVGMLVYTVISYFKVKRRIGTAVLLRENIFQSESVISPFVLGLVKPKIYLPFNMSEQDMSHVIAHEQAHIRRKDHWWKPFGFLLLAIHWFNPLMWLGYVLLCRDIELACDEKVIKELNTEQKADYSQALLTCSVNRRVIAACPLAFGEVGVKNRVKSVLNYKKPAFWIILIAIVASIVAMVCFLTNPITNRLGAIEQLKLDSTLYEKTSVMVSNGEEHWYVGAVDEDMLEKLFDLRISRKEVSTNRGEDRDKTNTLILNLSNGNEDEVMTSYVEDTHIHFNKEFTEVWVNNGVKPTLSYRVKAPEKAQAVFESIVGDNSISNIGGADGPENVTVDSVQKPPTLTVSCGDIGMNAWLGTYSWLYKNPDDGTAQAINADSSHPLSMLNSVPTLSIVPSTLSHVEPRLAVLQFAHVPDKIEVKCYAIDEKDTDRGEVISVKDMTFQMKEGRHLYEIIAEWTDGDESSGKVHYGFQTIESDMQIYNPDDSTGIHYPANQGLYNVTPSDQIQSKYDNEEFVIQKLHYKSNDGTWVCENYTYKYRLEISGRTKNADKNTTYIVLSNSKDITFEQTWKASGLSSLMSDYFDPKDAVIVGHRLFSITSVSDNLTTAISSVLNEKYKAEKPDGLIHIETYSLLAHQTASGTPLKGNSGHMKTANVYLLVYHMKYSINGKQLEEVSGDFAPTAMIFEIDENGKYTLKDYWTPQSGSNYERDVRSKFPGEAADNALNTEKYSENLIKESWRLANQYLNQIKSSSN